MMRRVFGWATATLFVGGMLAGTVGATAASASATAAPAGSQAAYCTALLALKQATNATASTTKPPTRKEAWAAEAKKYTKLAKVAPTQLRKALLTVAVYEAGLAKGKKPQSAKNSKALAKAYEVVGLAEAKCIPTGP